MRTGMVLGVAFVAAAWAGCGPSSEGKDMAAVPDMTAAVVDMAGAAAADMAGVDGAVAVDAAAADAAAVDGAAGAKTVMVDVGPNNSMSFSPAAVTINVGDTVTWNWQPSLPHSVTSGTPGAADGKFCSVPEGTTVNPANCMNFTMAVHTAPYTYSHTFATPGTFPYYCVNHGAAMTGTVTVQSSP